jgi:hypothetical protein
LVTQRLEASGGDDYIADAIGTAEDDGDGGW